MTAAKSEVKNWFDLVSDRLSEVSLWNLKCWPFFTQNRRVYWNSSNRSSVQCYGLVMKWLVQNFARSKISSFHLTPCLPSLMKIDPTSESGTQKAKNISVPPSCMQHAFRWTKKNQITQLKTKRGWSEARTLPYIGRKGGIFWWARKRNFEFECGCLFFYIVENRKMLLAL